MSKPVINIEKLAADLNGTCDSIESKLPDGLTEDDMTINQCHELDSLVFCCTQCGWWNDQPAKESKTSGEWVCDDCYGSDEEE